MAVELTTDPSRIATLVEKQLAADPVRGTILGSILADLRGPGAHESWCALEPATGALAIRSARIYPALFTDGWTAGGLREAVGHLSGLSGLRGLSGPVGIVDEAASVLGRPVADRMAMRLFRLDTLTEPAVAGAARAATDADRALLLDWCNAFHDEAGGISMDMSEFVYRILNGGRAWLWTDAGRTVSLAARRAPEGGSARVGPVYTPPAERGHGYGSAVTAAATRDILDDGAIPVLFTDLANPTSNKIYQALGYTAVEDRAVVQFS